MVLPWLPHVNSQPNNIYTKRLVATAGGRQSALLPIAPQPESYLSITVLLVLISFRRQDFHQRSRRAQRHRYLQ